MSDYQKIRARLEETLSEWKLRNGGDCTAAAVLGEQRDFARRVALAALDMSKSLYEAINLRPGESTQPWAGMYLRAQDTLAALEAECGAEAKEREGAR